MRSDNKFPNTHKGRMAPPMNSRWSAESTNVCKLIACMTACEATARPYTLRLISDGSAMQQSNETTHAAPELVNRSSIYSLHRPCDLHHGPRQDVTQWFNNGATLPTAQKRKQNHANTRAHQKTSSQHNKKYFLACQ